jgi:chromosome segregation ATPase
MEANKQEIIAVRQPRQTVFHKLASLQKVNDTLTQELEQKTQALKIAGDELRGVDKKVDKLQSLMAAQKDFIERLQVILYHASEDNRVVISSTETVSTSSQANLNIPDYNANTVWPAVAADKIRKLEDQLEEKRKFIEKIKNKLTSYRLPK